MPSTQATGLQTAAHETIDIATHRRRVVISGVIGTSIEWFDFLLYGLIAPAVFDRLFFPKLDPVAGTIAVLGVFAVGWMARPLGGIVFRPFWRSHRPQVDLVHHVGADGGCEPP